MSRFRGTVRGRGDGEASKLGTTDSGLRTECNGWTGGVTVEASVDTEGADVFYIYATAGSGQAEHKNLIGIVNDVGQLVKAAASMKPEATA